MDSLSIDLNGSEIAVITHADGILNVQFSRALLIRTMTGSAERTRWWQAGDLIVEEAEPQGPLPAGPLVCVGGDLDDNIYTYRDMLPIPLDSRGWVRCLLRFDGQSQPLVATGTAVRLRMLDVPRYIEHLRPVAGH